MSVNWDDISIVFWYDDEEPEPHHCGYCKERGCVTYGMSANTLTVEDYQALIDRGWRRSGKYCYKPVLEKSCCPQYTIKCQALNFSISKSHKKIIKKFNKFLTDGKLPIDKDEVDEMVDNDNNDNKEQPTTSKVDVAEKMEDEKKPKPGKGADPDKPPCKKAKLLRKQRKIEKLPTEIKKNNEKKPGSEAKSLEDFLEDIPNVSKLKLKIKIIDVIGDEWETTKDKEFALYKKYQTTVHEDEEEKLTFKGYYRFLCETPLKYKKINNEYSYGTFHQQYWIDDKLIAVGVIDILPSCVSSVYFFYDPDYRSLTLGTYGSLREIQLVRRLHEVVKTIENYYMGFYIHSCPKMRYKGKLVPSYLLCPETYHWIPIEKCLEKLNKSKYSRLDNGSNVDEEACNADELDDLKIWLNKKCKLIKYENYKKYFDDRETFDLIGRLIGKTLSKKMLFVFN